MLAGHGPNRRRYSVEVNEAVQILAELQQRSVSTYVPAYDFAVIYAGLDDKEQAFAWLNKACEESSSWMAYIRVEPRLDPLRSERRFPELLRRIGLPQ